MHSQVAEGGARQSGAKLVGAMIDRGVCVCVLHCQMQWNLMNIGGERTFLIQFFIGPQKGGECVGDV